MMEFILIHHIQYLGKIPDTKIALIDFEDQQFLIIFQRKRRWQNDKIILLNVDIHIENSTVMA